MPMKTENLPCPYCGEAVEYNPSFGGESGKCPACGETFVMPETQLSTLLKIRDYLYVIRLIVILLAIFVVYWLLAHW